MKFLCICQYGHSRSVACARELHRRGHQAVAVGFATAGTSIDVLTQWADRVICVTAEARSHVPLPPGDDRVWNWDVGPDRWVNPYHPDLAAIFSKRCDEAGL